MLPFDRKKVKQIVTEFEKENGNKLKDFSLKEITIMFHNDLLKRIESIEGKIEENAKKSNARYEIGLQMKADHDKVIAQLTSQLENISKEMPGKGWCTAVNNALWPAEPDIPLDQKVTKVWHEWRIFKYLMYVLITVGGANIVILAVKELFDI